MEKPKIKASIIIPHYNQTKFLKTVLPSIGNQTSHDYEVIIIDDCTPDKEAVEYIKTFIKDYKNMRLVENTQNMRFIRTVNKGIKLSNGEYICLLNCDTEVKSNFVERNIEILDSDASICGLSCIIVDRYGSNWWSGGSCKEGFPVNLTDDFEGIRSVDFVAGTAAFYRKEIFRKIGLFDESYRMYHEDVEFGLRIKAQTDYRACAFSDRLVIHYHVPVIPYPEILYLDKRNNIWLVRTYRPQLLPRVILKYATDIVMTLIKDILGLHPWLLFADLSGLRRNFRGIFAGLSQKPGGGPKLVED